MTENYIQQMAEAIRLQVSPDKLPDENSRLLFRVYAVLAIAKGLSVSEEDVHAAWVAWMTGIDPAHEALVPFEELDHDTRTSDRPYVEAIRAAVRAQLDES